MYILLGSRAVLLEVKIYEPIVSMFYNLWKANLRKEDKYGEG